MVVGGGGSDGLSLEKSLEELNLLLDSNASATFAMNALRRILLYSIAALTGVFKNGSGVRTCFLTAVSRRSGKVYFAH